MYLNPIPNFLPDGSLNPKRKKKRVAFVERAGVTFHPFVRLPASAVAVDAAAGAGPRAPPPQAAASAGAATGSSTAALEAATSFSASGGSGQDRAMADVDRETTEAAALESSESGGGGVNGGSSSGGSNDDDDVGAARTCSTTTTAAGPAAAANTTTSISSAAADARALALPLAPVREEPRAPDGGSSEAEGAGSSSNISSGDTSSAPQAAPAGLPIAPSLPAAAAAGAERGAEELEVILVTTTLARGYIARGRRRRCSPPIGSGRGWTPPAPPRRCGRCWISASGGLQVLRARMLCRLDLYKTIPSNV